MLTQAEWDKRVVRTVDKLLREETPAPMVVHRVYLDTDRHVVIEFTADERRGCRFAYRITVDDGEDDDGVRDTPQESASVILANLDELINDADGGLPQGDPATVTWIDG